MKKRKKISILLIILVILTTILLIPKVKIKSECQQWAELEGYWARCNNDKDKLAFWIPMQSRDCREYRTENNPVIWLNGKEYQNSCQACKDCQKNFLSNILRIILNIVK